MAKDNVKLPYPWTIRRTRHVSVPAEPDTGEPEKMEGPNNIEWKYNKTHW